MENMERTISHFFERDLDDDASLACTNVETEPVSEVSSDVRELAMEGAVEEALDVFFRERVVLSCCFFWHSSTTCP
jgi:hypothetical protein